MVVWWSRELEATLVAILYNQTRAEAGWMSDNTEDVILDLR